MSETQLNITEQNSENEIFIPQIIPTGVAPTNEKIGSETNTSKGPQDYQIQTQVSHVAEYNRSYSTENSGSYDPSNAGNSRTDNPLQLGASNTVSQLSAI